MEHALLKIEMRDELIGNFVQRILHGGVISSILGLACGIVAQLAAIKQMNGIYIGKALENLAKMSTVNLRFDFPGRKGWEP